MEKLRKPAPPQPGRDIISVIWEGNLSAFCSSGRHNLFSKALCYANILEKIIQDKSPYSVYKTSMENCSPVITTGQYVEKEKASCYGNT